MQGSARARHARLLATTTIIISAAATCTARGEDAQQQRVAANMPQTVETVTVSATRTARDVQKVSVAVTALTEKQIQEQAPLTLQDLNGSAPNVFIGMNTAGPGASAIFIRGLGYADIEKTQNPAVGVILDGVFFGTSTGQLLDTFDVSQIEVERGPQGIFFGKNTTAGVINVTRSAPTRDWGFKGSASYGSFDSTIARGVFNAPLGENGGIKIGGTWQYNYGDLLNKFTGAHAGGDRYGAVNTVVDYDITDWFNLRASYDYIHDVGGGYPVQYGNVLAATVLGVTGLPTYNPVTGSPDGLKIREINNDFRDSDLYENNIFNLIGTFQTPLGELVSQTAYMAEHDDVHQDFDGTCRPTPGCVSVGNFLLGGGFLHTIRNSHYKQVTQELRLSGTAFEDFDYLAGFYFYHHDILHFQNTDGAINQHSAEGNTSYSFFGNVDWNVIDTVKLSAGFRTIDENKDFRSLFDLLGAPITPNIKDKHSWSHVLSRFAAQWQVWPSTMVFASRSEGFRSGGFSIRGTLSEQQASQTNCGVVGGCPAQNFLTYNPETDTQYEAGVKNTFFGGALVANLTGFYILDKGFQFSNVVITPGYGPGTDTYISNLPKVESKGIELEGDVRVGDFIDSFDGLTLTTAVGIQKAKIVNGRINGQLAGIGPGGQAGAPGTIADFTGQTLARVPDYNVTIRGSYARAVGNGTLTLAAGYSYQDKFSLGNFGIAEDTQQGYGLVDAQIAYEWENYRLSVSGKNLTDVNYRDQSLPVVFFQGWGQPRTYMIELDAKY